MTLITSGLDNLPRIMTPFIGRVSEIEAIASRILKPECRLMTLVGLGGVGKTRLSLEVAHRLSDYFADGVWFVPLAPIGDENKLDYTIAHALNINFYDNSPTRQQLLNSLSDQNILLVLDNFEHLLEGVDLVSDILREAPDIKILSTSREVLNLQEEWVWKVRGLDFPNNDGQATNDKRYDAIELFIERAKQSRHDFSTDEKKKTIEHICQLVEGMPLAIELAASWSRSLSADSIVSRLQAGLDILNTNLRNVNQRHANIRTVFNQSWSLLTDKEQKVFCKLTIFRGGFTIEAATSVTGASLHVLSNLVDKSFIYMDTRGRYEIHTLMRQYGEEQLQQNPDMAQETLRSHAEYYTDWLAQLEEDLKGMSPVPALNAIEIDMENIQIAWGNALTMNCIDCIEQSVTCLGLYLQMRDKPYEGTEIFELAREHLEHNEYKILSSRILMWLGRFYVTVNYEMGIQNAVEGFTLWYSNGTQGDAALEISMARAPLFYYMDVQRENGQNDLYEQLKQMLHDDLIACRKRGDKWGEGWALLNLGSFMEVSVVEYTDVSFADVSLQMYNESLAAFREGNYYWASTFPLGGLERTLIRLKRFDKARAITSERLPILETTGDRHGVLSSYSRLVAIALLEGNVERFRKGFPMSLQAALDVRSNAWKKHHLIVAAKYFAMQGHILRAIRLGAVATKIPKPWDLTAERLLDELSETLNDQEAFDAEWKRGEALDLDTVIYELLAEFSPSNKQVDEDSDPNQALAEPLTERELEILPLLAKGLTNKQIATSLHVTPGTARVHIHNICQKLQATNRTHAVSQARTLNLL